MRIDCRRLALGLQGSILTLLNLTPLLLYTVDDDTAAQNIGISATDTVKKIVIKFYYKYVWVRFGNFALVAFYFVASPVYFQVHVAPYQAFNITFSRIDCN